MNIRVLFCEELSEIVFKIIALDLSVGILLEVVGLASFFD